MAEAAEEAQDRSVLDGLFDVEVEALEAAGSDEVVEGGVEVLELVDFIDLSALYLLGFASVHNFSCDSFSRVVYRFWEGVGRLVSYGFLIPA